MFHCAALLAIIVVVAGCAEIGGKWTPVSGRSGSAVSTAVASAETVPVASQGDAADDPAIWVDGRNPSRSLIIGTDKRLGLNLYDLEGRLLQSLTDGQLNNVDLRDGFILEGQRAVLVAATNRSDRTILLYVLDPLAQRLIRIEDAIVTGFDEPYGLCMYASPAGEHFVFASDAGSGRFRQWRLRAVGGRIMAERVREFIVGTQAEGCVADDELEQLYVAEEDRALWRYSAAPAGGRRRIAVDRVNGSNGLVADIEGVALWRGRNGRGYIVVSNQGANNYAVYRREEGNAFVGLFEVATDAARGIDGTSETDGLDVTSAAVGPAYPDGLLVVQDGRNEPAGQRQNFKLVSWRAVAAALRLAAQD
jgi:3-phytase